MSTPRLLSATTLIGTKVVTPEGESMGKIEDLMIDWDHGLVGYAVLSLGGFFGIGSKLYAIPIEAFDFDTNNIYAGAILDVTKERLESAPSVDKDKLPELSDIEFMGSVYSYYDITPYWERYQMDESLSN